MSEYRYRVERLNTIEDEWLTFLGSSRRIIAVLSTHEVSQPDNVHKYYLTVLVEEPYREEDKR